MDVIQQTICVDCPCSHYYQIMPDKLSETTCRGSLIILKLHYACIGDKQIAHTCYFKHLQAWSIARSIYVHIMWHLRTHSVFAFEDAIGSLVKKAHGTRHNFWRYYFVAAWWANLPPAIPNTEAEKHLFDGFRFCNDNAYEFIPTTVQNTLLVCITLYIYTKKQRWDKCNEEYHKRKSACSVKPICL